eukprot:GILJ01006514.1.p1 GENE.GILJ01006514.1~~GILJ01006514.1.p1  ORF type:complete len:381 (-),score=38.18 GILJ01006514.1:51-1193(-)
MAWAVQVVNSNGFLLYQKTDAGVPPSSFATTGLLQALSSTALQHQFILKVITSDDAFIVFDHFEAVDNPITIGLTYSFPYPNSEHALTYMKRITKLVYDCLVLLVGIDALHSLSHQDWVKRQLRTANQLIDYIFRDIRLGVLFNAIEVLPQTNVFLWWTQWITRIEQEGRLVGPLAVLYDGKVAAANNTWRNLDTRDQVLLSLLSENRSTADMFDIPVYVPNTNLSVDRSSPFRFLGMKLNAHISVVALCGSEPSLGIFQQIVRASISNLASLGSVVKYPELHADIVGYVLIDYDKKTILSWASNKEIQKWHTTVTQIVNQSSSAETDSIVRFDNVTVCRTKDEDHELWVLVTENCQAEELKQLTDLSLFVLRAKKAADN